RIEPGRIERGHQVVLVLDGRVEGVTDAGVPRHVRSDAVGVLGERLIALEPEVIRDVDLRLRVGARGAACAVPVSSQEVLESSPAANERGGRARTLRLVVGVLFLLLERGQATDLERVLPARPGQV